MKNFTLFFSFLLISVLLSAQENNNIQQKLRAMQKQNEKITSQLNKANEMVKRKNSGLRLKSDAISLKLDSTISQTYDDLGKVWQNDYRDDFQYDEQMRNNAFIESSWDRILKAWNDPEFKVEMSFESNGLVNSMLWYDTDLITNALVKSARFDYFYNTDGNPDSVLTYYSIDAGINWDLMAVQNNTYNASKQLIKAETREYDLDEEAFIPGLTMDYSYTGSGKILNAISSYNIEGIVYPFSGSEYLYDGSDRLTSIEYSELNFFTFTLEKSSRDKFEYNTNGDVSVQIYSSWNGVAWLDEDKDEYEYGTTSLSEVAFPVFFALQGEGDGFGELKYGKAINVINTFEMSGSSWKPSDITTFYYSGNSSTGINEMVNEEFGFYPNPASETVTFSWKENNSPLTVKIYGITGVQVLEQNTWSGKGISVSNLVNGVYFFKLMNGPQIMHTGKLVKR